MTGQGHAHRTGPLGTFLIELRTVNNRGFKLVTRLGESLGRLEPQIETVVRSSVRRGTVHLNIAWNRADGAGRYRIDTTVVASYFRQLEELRMQVGGDAAIDLARLTSLPGAIVEAGSGGEDEAALWTELALTLDLGLSDLDKMRASEGEAMQRQMLVDLGQLVLSLEAIQVRAPSVVDQYAERLRGKIEAVLRREGIGASATDLLREIQIFADRSDVSEELTRLRSHVDLFRQTLTADEGAGRKLDFVIQEMFRETNTIGSKASDAEIARHVVDMKCALERIRELVQNIE